MINLKSKSLESFLMFKLNIFEPLFNEKDLKKIESLDLDPIDINEEYHKIFLEELEYFTNLKYITISNMHVDISSFAYILRLNNLCSITFIDSTIEDLSILSNLKTEHIGFINSNIEDLSLINRVKGLKKLTLIGYNNINLSNFSDLNLNYLELNNSKINDLPILKNFDLLNTLYIRNTNIMDLSFLKNLKSLKELYITLIQYKNNISTIDTLIKKKVLVYIDNNIFLGGKK